ncbi:hypothetical protein SRHO_G00204590 [Serrasalmus rhombeus]
MMRKRSFNEKPLELEKAATAAKWSTAGLWPVVVTAGPLQPAPQTGKPAEWRNQQRDIMIVIQVVLVVCFVHVGGQTFGFVAALLLCWLWYSGASRLCSPMVLWDQVLDTLTVPVPGSGPVDVFSFMAQAQCGVGS